MAAKTPITPDFLRQVLRYDPDTGKLYWLPRPVDWFTSLRIANAWNAKCAGKEAFTAFSDGYKQGNILGHHDLAHRIAWAIHHGAWPVHQLDHINGDRADNRLVNLRDVPQADNQKNLPRPITNTSGRIGVSHFKKLRLPWRAAISVKRKTLVLGYFSTFEEACEARDKAEREHGFLPSHGRVTNSS